MLRIDLNAWLLWWKTTVQGVPARVLLREAVEEGDWQRAADIKEHTQAELEDGYKILE